MIDRRSPFCACFAGLLGLAALSASGCAANDPGVESPTTYRWEVVTVPANAAQGRVLSYPFEQVWPTAIRFLRVDRGFTITERDKEAGFLLFSFKSGEHESSGSLEMFRTKDPSGRDSVKVSITTGAGPGHLPYTLLEGLSRKVRKERGLPAPPLREEPPAPEPPKNGGEGDTPDEGPGDGSPPMMPPPLQPNQLK